MQNVGLIAKQGYKYVFVLGLLLLLALVLGVCQILFFALFALCIFWFRNPERALGSDDTYAVLSPIDGKIKSIDKIYYFDTQCVPQEKIPQLFLLSELIGAMDTKSHTYAEIANRMNLHTGGISYEAFAAARKGEPDSSMPLFRIRARAFQRNLPELFSLLGEILTETRFDDKKRLEELCGQCRAVMEMRVMSASQQAMAVRLASYLSPAGAYNEQAGLSFHRFIVDITDHFQECFASLSATLAELLPLVFRKDGLTFGLTLHAKDYTLFEGEAEAFCRRLPQESAVSRTYHWKVEAKNEGLLSSSRVQYVGKAANFLRLGFSYTGSLSVLETILRYDYFWTKIRVQGGAYGAFTQFSRIGLMLFGKYLIAFRNDRRNFRFARYVFQNRIVRKRIFPDSGKR